MTRKVLGRGLDALIPLQPATAPSPSDEEHIQRLPVGRIRPNPRQPRQQFDDIRLAELAQSIREKGVLEPLLVRPDESGDYELIAGERRLRASQLAGLVEVPAIVRVLDDREALEIALIENIQREDINPVDEARAYVQLSEEFGRTHAEIAGQVGKDRSTITNLIRILKLPQPVLLEVSRGTLTVGHARVLAGIDDAQLQTEAAQRILREGWNVRKTEAYLKRPHGNSARDKRTPPTRARDVVRVEEALRYALGTEVHLTHGPNGGKIEIRYEGTEELERILQVLGVQVH